MVFFEGSEKKLEVGLSPQGREVNFLQLDDTFWQNMVSHCGAEILSKIENSSLRAFLLSESSLFIWPRQLLMITCGRTNLVKSATYLMNHLGLEQLGTLVYQRKNELWAREQPSTFLEDVLALKKEGLDGVAMRFGEAHGHHNLLFHSAKAYTPSAKDKTMELLMYDIDPAISHSILEGGEEGGIDQLFYLDKIFTGFQMDTHYFSPPGHSLNAIKGDLYYTIHTTPQLDHSYVSIETNDYNGKEKVFQHFINLLSPNAFDRVSFNFESKPPPSPYQYKTLCRETLRGIGHRVEFSHYFKKSTSPLSPYHFKV